MAFGTTPVDANNIPVASVYVPGVGLKALQGAPQSTDGLGNDSAGIVLVHGAYTVLNLSSLARASYTSGPLVVGQFVELAFDIKVTLLSGGSSPTVTFKLSRIGADAGVYQLYLPAAISGAGTFSTSIGSGLTTNASFGGQVQIDMVVTGGPTSITFSGSLIGK